MQMMCGTRQLITIDYVTQFSGIIYTIIINYSDGQMVMLMVVVVVSSSSIWLVIRAEGCADSCFLNPTVCLGWWVLKQRPFHLLII